MKQDMWHDEPKDRGTRHVDPKAAFYNDALDQYNYRFDETTWMRVKKFDNIIDAYANADPRPTIVEIDVRPPFGQRMYGFRSPNEHKTLAEFIAAIVDGKDPFEE